MLIDRKIIAAILLHHYNILKGQSYTTIPELTALRVLEIIKYSKRRKGKVYGN